MNEQYQYKDSGSFQSGEPPKTMLHLSDTTSQNKELLDEFTEYCRKNPEQRFWQALLGWSGLVSIWAFYSKDRHGEDTYEWTTKDGE